MTTKKNNNNNCCRWLPLPLAAMLTACGQFDAPDTVAAVQMRINRSEATVMVGDTVKLSVDFTPQEVTAPKAFWYSRDANVGFEMHDAYHCDVFGTQPGDSWVYAVTLNGNMEDSCLVHVLPHWDQEFDHSALQYDMLVIADVNIRGHHNDPAVPVGVFTTSGELRGYGEVHTTRGRTYTAFRIWHNRSNSGLMRFRYYLPSASELGDCNYSVTFDGEAHGTLTAPILITEKD